MSWKSPKIWYRVTPRRPVVTTITFKWPLQSVVGINKGGVSMWPHFQLVVRWWTGLCSGITCTSMLQQRTTPYSLFGLDT